MTSTGILVAGSAGVDLQIYAGGYVLTGSTCVLRAAPGFPSAQTAVTLEPLTISPDGLSATYVTTGTDFPSGGEWNLQLIVTTPAGAQLPSAPMLLWVAPRL